MAVALVPGFAREPEGLARAALLLSPLPFDEPFAAWRVVPKLQLELGA